MKKMTKKSEYVNEWNVLKSNVGTINKCLTDFVNNIKSGKTDTNFQKFVLSQVSECDSNKALNNKFYSAIKEFGKIGQERTTKRTDKNGCETITKSIIKCSEYVVFRYFWNQYKK